MDADFRARLRDLPSVHELIAHSDLADVREKLAGDVFTSLSRDAVNNARSRVLSGGDGSVASIVDEIQSRARNLFDPARKIVVNGTGVIIHTNLGRSPVSEATANAMAFHASFYQALEVHLETGERGGRGEDVSELMRLLTGAERTLVVNNNAAAVLLTLAALTAGGDVIVSRGEAVEIGGGFRIPDVLRQSGATLVEVGTTNRTYLRDYEHATTDATAAYLKVHSSNFAISGFTATASLHELAVLAAQRSVYLIEDVGSGCLMDTTKYGLAHEPTLTDSIASGVDVVCASGDKLLGGPQAGLILGKADVVRKIAAHPLARAVRADKTSLAGVAATLRHYLAGEAEEQVPVWWMMSREADWLLSRVKEWRTAIDAPGLEIIETESVVGGGSLPGRTQPSYALAIRRDGLSTERLAAMLRTGTPAVFPRIVDPWVAIDARTVLEGEDDMVIEAVRNLLG